MDQAKQVAQQFIEFYYKTFQENRNELAKVYTPDSVLIYEGSDIIKGSAAIVAKLNTLPPVRSQPQTVDVEPGPTGNLLVIFVTGQLMVEEGKPLKFSQVFQLVASGPGQFYVHNDIFRLNYS